MSFTQAASKLIFGESSVNVSSTSSLSHLDKKLNQIKIASIQTVAGTGANRLGAVFLKKHFPVTIPTSSTNNNVKAYVGIPTWGNYEPLFRHAGFETESYRHYDSEKARLDFTETLNAVRMAPKQSIFILQACCHNPTGADLSREQWSFLAKEFKAQSHFAFFDVAYQGFGSEAINNGVGDVWGLRYFKEQGIPMLVCQSFSKNMGMYAERAGALHVVCDNSKIATNVLDTLRSLARWEYSSAPAYGAQLASIILNDTDLYCEWGHELGAAGAKLKGFRSKLHELLTQKFRTPGDWDHILLEKGLFSFLKLSKPQIQVLVKQYHIYLPDTGRINIAGLNDRNIEVVAEAIDRVVRQC